MQPDEFIDEIKTGPQLDHNREAARRLIHAKRAVAVVAFLAVFPVALLAPADYLVQCVVGLLVLAIIAFGYLDLKRVLIFRRDVRERLGRDRPPHG